MDKQVDYLVCTCMGVTYSDILYAIDNNATTFEQLSVSLLVGTGCSSCVGEVYSIIKEQEKLKNLKKPQ